PAEVAGADTFTAVTAGEGDAVVAVEQHVRLEAPRHAEVTAPAMADPGVTQLREQLAEQVAAQADFLGIQVKVLPQLAGEAVTTTGAKHQAVVGAALAVGDLTTEFAEGLAALEA